MGIERFYNTFKRIIPGCVFPIQKKINTRYLLLDFNSIAHTKSKEVTGELNKILLLQINNKMTNELEKFNNKYKTNISNIADISYDELDTIVATEIKFHVKKILTTYINSEKLEYFYIAIDGTPSKAKMFEQRKRRYVNYIMLEMKKHIYEKNRKKLDTKRVFYEEHKYEWNTGGITPGTKFMYKLENELIAKDFIDEIKLICKNLKEYIYSGTGVPGEAEKKLVNYVKKLSYRERTVKTDNITIYSPDADVIVLSMLLHLDIGDSNGATGIKVLREDKITEYIEIDIACNYLYESLAKKEPELQLIKNNILMDLCYVFTIFGDDFVPKIESYSVFFHVDEILKRYVRVLSNGYKKNNKISYLIKKSSIPNKLVELDQSVFIELIKELHIGEARNLQMMYMFNKYMNIENIVKLFNANKTNFIDNIEKFLSKLRDLTGNIRNNKSTNDFVNDDDFFTILRKVIDIERPSINNIELIEQIKTYYHQNNKFPILKIKLIKFDKTIKSNFHQKNIEKILDNLDSSMAITDYDKELYKFNNMLDEYQEKLGAYESDIGYISINTRDYTLKNRKMQDEIVRYYRKFNILSVEIKNEKMQDLLYSYLEGFLWVFDYYYNTFNNDETEFGNIWVYKYHRAPLLTQLYLYLRGNSSNPNFMSDITKSLKKYYIPRANYFNTIQQLLYVTPPFKDKDLPYVPEEYKKFFRSKIYLNMEKVVEDIIHNKNKLLDCEGAMFLSKCHLNGKDFPITDTDFMYEVNKIKSDSLKFKPVINHNYNKISMSRLRKRKNTKKIKNLPTR